MVTLIVGSRGSGKTKQMVDLINKSVSTADGNVVCIEKGMKLTYDLDHKCRLIDMEEYKIHGYDTLYGFIAGILAGNYDITDLYVDGILKIGEKDLVGLGNLIDRLEELAGENVRFTITVSSDEETLPEGVRKYL